MKNKIIIEINDMVKYDELSDIISNHCELQIWGSGDFDSRKQINNDRRAKCGVYKFIENHTAKDLFKELGILCRYVTFRDADSKKVLGYVGTIIISFDKVKHIKIGTFKKIDELKKFKTDLGYCKGNKPLFRPMEDMDIVNMEHSELIYLISDSIDNIIELEGIVEERILEIDPNFKVDFRLFD